jgi:hypothetical protein
VTAFPISANSGERGNSPGRYRLPPFQDGNRLACFGQPECRDRATEARPPLPLPGSAQSSRSRVDRLTGMVVRNWGDRPSDFTATTATRITWWLPTIEGQGVQRTVDRAVHRLIQDGARQEI